MRLPKYVAVRNGVYQFHRRVPKDVAEKIGVRFWRSSLKTDSLTEAEKRVRAEADRTDAIIRAVHDGTYRQFTDIELDDIAIRWGYWYTEASSATLPAAFPRFRDALVYEGEPIGDEEPRPIIQTKEQLAGHVGRFLDHNEIAIVRPSPDWDKLLDLCQNEFYWGNPEITFSSFFGALGPSTKLREKAKLSNVFRLFCQERTRDDADNPITASSITDYRVAVERFIDLFGDIDVETIERRHAEEFRNLLRRLPTRPPNDVRKLSVRDQVEWAEANGHQLLSKDTVAKLITGMQSLMRFANENTSVITDRKLWENPFIGFISVGRRHGDAKRIAFQINEIPLVFDTAINRPRKLGHFWPPLLLLFTGARRDEITQLHVRDVQIDAEIPHVAITEQVHPSIDLAEHPFAAKRLKTWSSQRVAPLRPELFEIGFREYFDWIQSRGKVHLFPDLPHHLGGNRGNKLSTFFTNLRRKSGLQDDRLVMHSLRHSFEMMCEKSEVKDSHQKLVMGRYVGDDVSLSHYAIHFREDVEGIKEFVHDRITFPTIDTEALRRVHHAILQKAVDNLKSL